MIKKEFCDLPLEQTINNPITGKPMSTIIRWGDPPICLGEDASTTFTASGYNRALSDCLYSLPNVYPDGHRSCPSDSTDLSVTLPLNTEPDALLVSGFECSRVYSDMVILLDTMERIRTIEETFPDSKFRQLESVYTFKDLKLIFHLSKTLNNYPPIRFGTP